MECDIERLLKTLSRAKRLLIVTHDNPDPDALVTACALARFASAQFGLKSRICCDGIIGRAENRVLARGLPLKLMAASRLNWSKWRTIALVDSQPGTGNNALPKGRVPDIVLDHHPLRRRTRGRYVDVRPECGACATIVTEYLDTAGVEVSADLAAGICYAIASETQYLSRETSAADEAAYMRHYPRADKQLLSRILRPRLGHAYFSTLARAVLAAFTYGNIIGAHLGEVSHPDSVSFVADLLLQHERMGWSITTGIWRGDLYVSLRSRHRKSNAGRVLRRVVGARGYAGGHHTMAGGRATLQGLDKEAREQLPGQLVQRLVYVLKRRKDVPLKPLVDAEEINAVCKPQSPNV